MGIDMANLKAQYAAIKDDLDVAVRRVFETCRFVLGESVQNLEEEVARHSGARFGVSVASGTDAILIALKAIGVGPGHEVITTPFTFVATTEAIVLAGATPVYADIDLDSFNIDPSDVERRITPRTRAIVPVHLYGRCADMDAIGRIAKRHGVAVVADAAQAIGAEENGRRVGEMGDAVTLSFFPTKNLGAYGDGGMILTNDEAVAEKATSLRFHGMVPGSYHYRDIGYCSRLDELQAAVLLVKLRRLESWNDRRRRNAKSYISALSGTSVVTPSLPADGKHTFHQFTIRHPNRDALRSKLQEKGVASMIYYPLPLHLQPAYTALGYGEGSFPKSELAASEVLSLPVHPELTDDEVAFVAEAVAQSAAEASEA